MHEIRLICMKCLFLLQYVLLLTISKENWEEETPSWLIRSKQRTMWKTEYVSRFYGLPSTPALGLEELQHIEAKAGKISRVEDRSGFGGFIWNCTQLHRVWHLFANVKWFRIQCIPLLSKHVHHSREKVMLVISSSLVPNIPQLASL